MNLGLTNNPKNDLLFVTFNQDNSCLAVGTTKGFSIYRTDQYDKLTKCFECDDSGMGIVELLFCTSLVALVGCGDDPSLSPRKLKICNTRSNATICELNFVTTILAVKMNKKRLVVVLETKIYIYDIASMKILDSIETAPNPKGICALSPSDNSLLAYPASTECGDIAIFDALRVSSVTVIDKAHKGPLSTMGISQDGTLLATASTKGTVIRVFSLPNATKSYALRRGTYPAAIYSISFSPDNSLICASSNNGTIHIFKMQINSASSGLGYYLPVMLNEMWEPARAFAQVKLPFSGVRSICSLKDNHTVFVVTDDGEFLQYSLTEGLGGVESKLIIRVPLLPNESEKLTSVE